MCLFDVIEVNSRHLVYWEMFNSMSAEWVVKAFICEKQVKPLIFLLGRWQPFSLGCDCISNSELCRSFILLEEDKFKHQKHSSLQYQMLDSVYATCSNRPLGFQPNG
jgi:hypothetical protein